MTHEAIGPESSQAAAETLAASFANDPVFRWAAHGRDGLDRRLIPGFRAIVNGELRRDGALVHMTPDAGCVSIWHAPDRWKASTLETVRATPGLVRSFNFRVGRLLSLMTGLERQHPSAPHYHLAFIGTDPERQGTGLGTQLMAPIIDRCDREGVPAYLENSNPANEAFYARHGFIVTGSLELPDGAPPVTAMWRDPR